MKDEHNPEVPHMTDDHNPEVSHYKKHPTGIEAKYIAEGFTYHIGTAIVYLWRAAFKHEDPTTDYIKAIDHIRFEIDRLGREK